MKKVYLNTLTPEEIIKRLKAGEVVKRMTTDDEEIIYKMIGGIIVRKDEDSTTINVCIIVDEDEEYYFEEEEPFEITEIGFYKTRDGRKAYVSYISIDGSCAYVIDGENWVHKATIQGRYSGNKEYGEDIVAKWED